MNVDSGIRGRRPLGCIGYRSIGIFPSDHDLPDTGFDLQSATGHDLTIRFHIHLNEMYV